jgi:hypothetical protein
MRKVIRLTIGITLCVIGFIGGFIPILQGWIFMIPGLIILSEFFPPVRRLLNWAKARAKKAGMSFHDPAEAADPPESGTRQGSDRHT